MTSFSDNTNRSSAALSLIVILLFAASIPLLVHGQNTGNLLISFLNTILGILRGFTGPILPPTNVTSILTPILTNASLPVNLSVVGQLTCPGQGTGAGGVPVNLTCITNNLQVLRGQSITNANGTFNINANVSTIGVIGLLLGILPNNTIPCLVSAPLRQVQSAVTCPLNNTANSVVSVVQIVRNNTFSSVGRILNANASGSIAV